MDPRLRLSRTSGPLLPMAQAKTLQGQGAPLEAVGFYTTGYKINN